MSPWFITLPFFHWVQVDNFESYHEMRFEKDSRYFVLRLDKDLFSDWTITAINGRIKSKLGQSRTFAFDNYKQAFEQLCLLTKIRKQRKYQLVGYKTYNILFMYLFVFSLSESAKANLNPPQKEQSTKLMETKPKTTTILNNNEPNQCSNGQISFDF